VGRRRRNGKPACDKLGQFSFERLRRVPLWNHFDPTEGPPWQSAKWGFGGAKARFKVKIDLGSVREDGRPNLQGSDVTRAEGSSGFGRKKENSLSDTFNRAAGRRRT